MRMSGLPSVSGNGSALVRPDGVALQFVTVVTEDGWKRRPAVFRATEAGSWWAFMSYITPEVDDGAGRADRSPADPVLAAPLFLSAGDPFALGPHPVLAPRPARPDRDALDRGLRLG